MKNTAFLLGLVCMLCLVLWTTSKETGKTKKAEGSTTPTKSSMTKEPKKNKKDETYKDSKKRVLKGGMYPPVGEKPINMTKYSTATKFVGCGGDPKKIKYIGTPTGFVLDLTPDSKNRRWSKYYVVQTQYALLLTILHAVKIDDIQEGYHCATSTDKLGAGWKNSTYDKATGLWTPPIKVEYKKSKVKKGKDKSTVFYVKKDGTLDAEKEKGKKKKPTKGSINRMVKLRECDEEEDCNGNGKCKEEGPETAKVYKCECEENWTGSDCNTWSPPWQDILLFYVFYILGFVLMGIFAVCAMIKSKKRKFD